jgi:hypothetical protein
MNHGMLVSPQRTTYTLMYIFNDAVHIPKHRFYGPFPTQKLLVVA